MYLSLNCPYTFLKFAKEFCTSTSVTVTFFTLLFQVSNICDPTAMQYDCFDSNNFNLSALPLNCSELDSSINVTCLHITFDPIIAAAVAGGFLKIVPSVLIGSTTYFYLRLLKRIRNALKGDKRDPAMQNTHKHSPTLIFIIFVFQGLVLIFGIIGVVLLVQVESLRPFVFYTVNPLTKIRNISLVVACFLIGGVLWTVHPQSRTAVRYHDSKWKENVTQWQARRLKKKRAMRKARRTPRKE